jgi:hypothetical protein
VENAYAQYRASSEPMLVPSAVLFLDVLGTAEKREGEDSQRYLRQTHAAFAEARTWGESARGASQLTVATWFSDNLAMAVPVPTGAREQRADAISLLVMYAALHQLSLALNGLFARGAITFGPFYADADFVHGPALNEAHRLESKVAAYPRVILDDVAMQALREGPGRDEEFGTPDTRLMVCDDDWPFVDYLRYLEYVTLRRDDEVGGQRRHRERLRDALTAATEPQHRDKLLWLAAYHDHHVGRSGNGALLEGGGPPWRFRFADPDLAP